MFISVNNNIFALNAQLAGNSTNKNISDKLLRLSTGVRLNSAADDTSGMTIANNLRGQVNTLGQSMRNANDVAGIAQIAGQALDEQIKIINVIKVKAARAAMDGQSSDSRASIQQDIKNLLKELDSIAANTLYNGTSLLSGSFTNKKFQVGGKSGETVGISLDDTSSKKIGSTRFETTQNVAQSVNMSRDNAVHIVKDGVTTTIANTIISHSSGTGLGALAEAINRYSDKTTVKATAIVQTTASGSVLAGNITNLVINSVTLGDIYGIKASDSDSRLVDIINASSRLTGVYSSIDERGRLNLNSIDGRGIKVTTGTTAGLTNIGLTSTTSENYGKLTLSSIRPGDIVISSAAIGGAIFNDSHEVTLSLSSINTMIVSSAAQAIGGYANKVQSASAHPTLGLGMGSMSRAGAMMTMDLAENAIKQLSKVRSTLGSTQNQIYSKLESIGVMQVNLSAAESQIRDSDFAVESMDFSKGKILSQSGNFSISQASKLHAKLILSYLR